MSHGTSRRTFLALSSVGLASSAGLVADRSAAAPHPIEPTTHVPERERISGEFIGKPVPTSMLDAATTRAIENVAREGFTDILPRPFEADMLSDPRLRRRLQAHVRACAESIRRGGVGGVEVISLPKRTAFAVRRATVTRPADAIFYLTLAILAAPEIESHRIARSQRRVFSYRFAPEGDHLFDGAFQYVDFVHAVNARAISSGGAVVSADIECFYERISLSRLRESLLRCSVDERIVARIISLLDHWRQSGGDDGLPIGSNASRILAEAILIPVDDALVDAGIDFYRFVDDYRLFAPTLEVAQAWHGLLAEQIERIGLSLNARKTGIVSAAEVVAAEPFVDAVLKAEVRRRHAQVDSPKSPPKDSSKSGRKKGEPDIIKRPQYDPAPSEFKRDKGRRGYLQSIDLGALDLTLSAAPELKANALVRVFVDAAVEQNDRAAFAAFPRLMTRYPQFVSYCTSALIYCAEELDAALRSQLADKFQGMLTSGDIRRDYFCMQVIQLLGSPGFGRPGALKDFALHQVKRQDSYLVRVAIDGLRAVATGEELVELMREQSAFGGWAQRSLMKWAIEAGGTEKAGALASSDEPFAVALRDQNARMES